MPRCLMAKKWKAYPWPDRIEEPTIDNNTTSNEEEEEIDVVGDSSSINNHNNSNSNSNNNNNNNNSNNNSTSSNNNNNETNNNLVTKTTTIISSSCWGPSSPTAGATAPSPPPHSPEATRGSTILYNGYGGHDVSPMHFTAYLPRSENEVSVLTSSPYTSSNLPSQQQSPEIYRSRSPRSEQCHQSNLSSGVPHLKVENSGHQRKSLAMCFTSTGATLSLPPKKKDIYRPYSLDDRNPNQISSQLSPQHSTSPTRNYEIRIPAEEDLHAAHAILDLSASTAFLPQPPQIIAQHTQCHTPTHQVHQVLAQQYPLHQHDLSINCDGLISDDAPNYKERKILISPSGRKSICTVQNENDNITNINSHETITSTIETGTKLVNGKTVAYTYEAFFVSDGRSKKKITDIITDSKSKYTCSECGKQYATSSNLSRHKQTHRSLDSQAAKKCMTCGKAYVSMPALAMHVLTHKLAHSCGVCGKLFSRPWLLQGHLRSHTGEKPYGCAHCGKAFADRSNLRAHMQTHSADKNFECQRCHKTFALKSYLNKHLESACFKEEGSITTTQNGSHVIIVNNYSNDNLVQPPSPSPSSSSLTYKSGNTNLISNSNEMLNNFSG